MKKKITRAAIVGAIVAAGFTVLVPTGTSLATTKVDCNNHNDYLQLSVHGGNPGNVEYKVFCYANKGSVQAKSNLWLDKVSTGNNKVDLFDSNGDKVVLNKWNIRTYPNRPMHIASFTIL